MLKTQEGRWVAYHGDRYVGSGRTETELHQRCLRQGLPEEEFIVLLADRQALSDRGFTELPLDR
jgi:hypothetical protein